MHKPEISVCLHSQKTCLTVFTFYKISIDSIEHVAELIMLDDVLSIKYQMRELLALML